MKGIILHGGHGTRLRPLTHTGPKQLLPIANKPMSEYCVEAIKDCGITEIAIIIGGIGSKKVKEYYGDGSKFNLTLTDQVINQVDNLKSLYSTAAEDPEMFEQVSSEISSTINEIAASVTPEASDSYLDGLIQEIFKAVEDKKSEVEKQIKDKDAKITRKKLKAK